MKRTVRIELSSLLYRSDGLPTFITFIVIGNPTPVKIKKQLRNAIKLNSYSVFTNSPLEKYFLQMIKMYPDHMKFDYKNKSSQVNNIFSEKNVKIGHFAFYSFNVLPVEEEKNEIKIKN